MFSRLTKDLYLSCLKTEDLSQTPMNKATKHNLAVERDSQNAAPHLYVGRQSGCIAAHKDVKSRCSHS